MNMQDIISSLDNLKIELFNYNKEIVNANAFSNYINDKNNTSLKINMGEVSLNFDITGSDIKNSIITLIDSQIVYYNTKISGLEIEFTTLKNKMDTLTVEDL